MVLGVAVPALAKGLPEGHVHRARACPSTLRASAPRPHAKRVATQMTTPAQIEGDLKAVAARATLTQHAPHGHLKGARVGGGHDAAEVVSGHA